jgi:hypothetical protein
LQGVAQEFLDGPALQRKWKNAGRWTGLFSDCSFGTGIEGKRLRRFLFMAIMEQVKQRILPEGGEGPVGRAVERYAERVPSDFFFWAAAGSIMASLALKASKKDHASLFVGQWAPTFLVLGLFNKLVKTHRET